MSITRRILALAVISGFTLLAPMGAVGFGGPEALLGSGDLAWFARDSSCDFYAYANNVAVQSDSKPVLIGKTSGGGWTIARFTAAGNLDLSFGNNGKVELFSGFALNHAFGIAIDSSDRIIVVGREGFPARFTVARLLNSGALDTSFDGDGLVVTAFSKSNEDIATAVLVQPDGKIVAAGTTRDRKSYKAYALARYNPDGSLDSTFGKKIKKNKPERYGYMIDDPTSRKDDSIFQGAIAVQSTGKILTAGFVNQPMNSLDIQGWTVSRYNTDGSLDTSFGDDGRNTLTAFGPLDFLKALGLGVQSDDKIVLGGRGRGPSTLPFVYGIAIRYTSDGAVDTSFGLGGLAMTSDPASATNIAIQADNLIVIGTGTETGGIGAFRWTPDGLPDLTFGTGGQSVLTGAGVSTAAIGLALNPAGGDIYVSGGSVTSIAKFYSQ